MQKRGGVESNWTGGLGTGEGARRGQQACVWAGGDAGLVAHFLPPRAVPSMSRTPTLTTGPSLVYQAFPQWEAEHPGLGSVLLIFATLGPRPDPGPRWVPGTHRCPASPAGARRRTAALMEGRRVIQAWTGCQTWGFCEPPHHPKQ